MIRMIKNGGFKTVPQRLLLHLKIPLTDAVFGTLTFDVETAPQNSPCEFEMR